MIAHVQPPIRGLNSGPERVVSSSSQKDNYSTVAIIMITSSNIILVAHFQAPQFGARIWGPNALLAAVLKKENTSEHNKNNDDDQDSVKNNSN